MACGCPVVASTAGAAPEAVTDGETGLLVPPEDEGAVAAALDRILGNEFLARQMGEAARRSVEDYFAMDKYIVRVLKNYRTGDRMLPQEIGCAQSRRNRGCGVCTVRQGKYFRIPENPIDLEQMWGEAELLTAARLPAWLGPEDTGSYRYLGCTSIATPAAGNPDVWLSEQTVLEAAGLVVDQDPQHGSMHRLYIPAPTEDVWSIGIYAGQSPFDVQAPRGLRNPVLTRESVSDVPAAFVADPFMIEKNGSWYMFFEVMNWRTGKGEIGLAQSPDGFAWTYRQIVLAEPVPLVLPLRVRVERRLLHDPGNFSSGLDSTV